MGKNGWKWVEVGRSVYEGRDGFRRGRSGQKWLKVGKSGQKWAKVDILLVPRSRSSSTKSAAKARSLDL